MMVATKQKRAIYFPEFQVNAIDSKPPSLFSRESVLKTESLLIQTHNELGGLLGLVVEKYKTKQLEQQINILKQGVDVSCEEKERQLSIKFEEEVKRIQIRLEANKKKLRLDFERFSEEVLITAEAFELDFEKNVKTNQIFRELIQNQFDSIMKYKKFVDERIPSVFHHHREYIVYCDLQKKAIDQINLYLSELV